MNLMLRKRNEYSRKEVALWFLYNFHQALLVMSTRAYDALSSKQMLQLQAHVKLVHSPIPTIEDLGGGSVRCMLAEVY